MGILLIEDSVQDEALITHALGQLDQETNVHTLQDGEEALAYLFPSAEDAPLIIPDVIFLDLKLPKVDGMTVLKTIKDDARLKLIPVVILTSSNQEVDVSKAYELGANSYVVKPIRHDDLERILKLLGIYWIAYNQSVHW